MKTLDNKKVFVSTPEIRNAVQEKAFKLGFKFNLQEEDLQQAGFLFFSSYRVITFSKDLNFYINRSYEEITAAEILAMDIPEPEEKFYTFQKVLVRDRNRDEWLPDFFSCKVCGDYPYQVISGVGHQQCIDYKKNKHLAFTTDKP